jgi:proteic killer suppression protein
MIKSIQHKGLKMLYEDDNPSKLVPSHVNKVRNILTRLEFANHLDDINMPGARLHPLLGDKKGYFSLKVSGNWRIIFRFEDKHFYDVDYLDYH